MVGVLDTGVALAVGVRVGVLVGVLLGVEVDTPVCVAVGESVGVRVAVGVRVGVAVPTGVTYWDATQPEPMGVVTGTKVVPPFVCEYPVTVTSVPAESTPMMLSGRINGVWRRLSAVVT